MRAVGYVAPHRLAIDAADELPTTPISWSAVIQPAAGSWGIARSGDDPEPGPPPDHPAERIIRYCADNGHNLVAVLGITGGSDALREQLELPTEGDAAARPGDAHDAAQDGDDGSEPPQFRDLLMFLTPPAGHPALVLIHDAAHLASDVETLTSRLVQIRRTGSDTFCTDPETPDPLLSGLATLPLTRDAAPQPLGSHDATPDSDVDAVTPTADNAARPDADAIPKVIALAAGGKVLGRTPYGYRSNDDGVMAPVPHEAEVVRRVFGWYVGDGDDAPIGMRAIVQRLDAEQVPTRSGKPWSTAAVSLMLKNRAYVGTYARYRFMVPGNHEPLVDRDTFERAQRGMVSRRNSGERGDVAASFRLSGILRCAECGHAVPGMTRKRSWRRSDDTQTSKVYRYYEYSDCPRRRGSRRRSASANGSRDRTKGSRDDGSDAASDDARSRADAGCPSWRADDLEQRVAEHLVALTTTARRDIVPARATTDAPQRHRAAVRRFAAAVDRVAAGRGDLEALLPNIDELAETRARLREHATARRASPASMARDQRLVADHIADIAADIDVATTRNALGAIVDHVAVSPTDIEVVTRSR